MLLPLEELLAAERIGPSGINVGVVGTVVVAYFTTSDLIIGSFRILCVYSCL